MYRYPTEKMAALRTEIDRFRDFVWMQCEYNDCTAATVGSILGAVIGIDRIPAYWYECFNNTVRTYMIGRTTYAIDEVAADLCDMARAGLHR